MILFYEDFIAEAAIFKNTKGGKFFGDVGAGVLPICLSTKRALVCLRSEHVNEPNTGGIVGGRLDDDEDPKEGALRELREETYYKGDIKLIPAFKYVSADKSFTYHNFIGLVDQEFRVYVNRETDRGRWLSYEELLKVKPKHFGLRSLLTNAKEKIKSHM